MNIIAKKSIIQSLLIGLLALVVAQPLWASGFSIFEQSAKASGMAGAFAARADDASANWYNPAALVWLDEDEIQFGINFITAGEDADFTSSDARFGIFAPTTFDAEGSIETPIHLYYAKKFNNNFSFGLGITTPFGLVTEWRDRPITFSAQKSELTTFVINPNFAFRLTETWSLAVGLDYILADIGEFSREVPVDLDGNPLNGFEVIGFSNLTGDGDDLGWNIALHYNGGSSRFGLTYRSDLTPEIEGDIAFTGFGPVQPFFQDSPGRAPLPLPEQAAIADGWDAGSNWEFEIDIAYAGWSSIETLFVDIDNEAGFVEDIRLREDWDDTFSYRFGAAYTTASNNEWRFGAVLDESPVPEDTARPSIPDSDRTGGTLGFGHKGNKWSLDAYYMALFFDDFQAVGLEEGVIQGEYSVFVHLAGLTLSRRF